VIGVIGLMDSHNAFAQQAVGEEIHEKGLEYHLISLSTRMAHGVGFESIRYAWELYHLYK
jgi:hypothetical protein